jgi:hypothetical protein
MATIEEQTTPTPTSENNTQVIGWKSGWNSIFQLVQKSQHNGGIKSLGDAHALYSVLMSCIKIKDDDPKANDIFNIEEKLQTLENIAILPGQQYGCYSFSDVENYFISKQSIIWHLNEASKSETK